MRFAKLHGCGNDYLYVDCLNAPPPGDPTTLARAMSDRHFGVGSDGLILALPSESADVRMRMFNADGSEGEMCGNGVRCLAKFVHDRGIARHNPLRVQTLRGIISIHLAIGDDGRVHAGTADMDEPLLDSSLIPTTLPGPRVIDRELPDVPGRRLTCVSMGSPHAVQFVDDVQTADLPAIGPRIEHAPCFPRRINYHVAQAIGHNEARVRTWERGSGITLACGTGACAVVVAGVLTGRLHRQALVHMPGGDLQIEWRESNNRVYMTGPTVEVFEGCWPVDRVHSR